MDTENRYTEEALIETRMQRQLLIKRFINWMKIEKTSRY